MIDRDLELLGVVKQLTHQMPGIVLHLLEQMRDGMLPADKLRELAGIAGDLAEALNQRADEIDPAGGSETAPLVINGSVLPPKPPGAERGPTSPWPSLADRHRGQVT